MKILFGTIPSQFSGLEYGQGIGTNYGVSYSFGYGYGDFPGGLVCGQGEGEGEGVNDNADPFGWGFISSMGDGQASNRDIVK